MIIWIILFLLIIGISFLLALASMKDYQEIPQNRKTGYGLFLIRQTDHLNAKALDFIRKQIQRQGLIVSFERLFKGNQSALTVFGPAEILGNLTHKLNLLELEDYTSGLSSEDMVIWEVGVRGKKTLDLEGTQHIFKDPPKLLDEEQFFWQVVVGATDIQIRAALLVKDPSRRKMLASLLQSPRIDGLVKVPRPFGAEQMLSFFQQRALSKDSRGPILDSMGLVHLLKV